MKRGKEGRSCNVTPPVTETNSYILLKYESIFLFEEEKL